MQIRFNDEAFEYFLDLVRDWSSRGFAVIADGVDLKATDVQDDEGNHADMWNDDNVWLVGNPYDEDQRDYDETKTVRVPVKVGGLVVLNDVYLH